ncbi:hypothetical protein BU24DRAFT_457508 [Aaosphaeria arxii CBS 175.79]|uniref:Uncharacterized protein n=1 Tax=Aaosphaeria arxii CBS 175.79 TaxID=1450172 RepID=A0A6A5Y877_9PLEO|nr:uncharacterized protein BU24DRAFT_457508 [Aaosphaeria arxii CBS 175.79]KAF2021529.1 hypothetical protein BU24DRAFT_457508 [Aaosphaeria arxii CBS 175.79]
MCHTKAISNKITTSQSPPTPVQNEIQNLIRDIRTALEVFNTSKGPTAVTAQQAIDYLLHLHSSATCPETPSFQATTPTSYGTAFEEDDESVMPMFSQGTIERQLGHYLPPTPLPPPYVPFQKSQPCRKRKRTERHGNRGATRMFKREQQLCLPNLSPAVCRNVGYQDHWLTTKVGEVEPDDMLCEEEEDDDECGFDGCKGFCQIVWG